MSNRKELANPVPHSMLPHYATFLVSDWGSSMTRAPRLSPDGGFDDMARIPASQCGMDNPGRCGTSQARWLDWLRNRLPALNHAQAIRGAGLRAGSESAPNRSQSSRSSVRICEMRPALTPYRSATTLVRSPHIRSSMIRRVRSVCPFLQALKSMRYMTCTSGGVCVLSRSASSKTLSPRELRRGRVQTVKG